jgi:hypothetical protein
LFNGRETAVIAAVPVCRAPFVGIGRSGVANQEQKNYRPHGGQCRMAQAARSAIKVAGRAELRQIHDFLLALLQLFSFRA